MNEPIPIASLGANPEVARQLVQMLLPRYNIVHACTSLASATAELPPLFAGNLETLPSSGVGNNAFQDLPDRRVPRAIVFGGAVTDEEVAIVMGAVEAQTPHVTMVRVTRQDILEQGADTPSPEVIARVLHEKLGAMVEVGRLQ